MQLNNGQHFPQIQARETEGSEFYIQYVKLNDAAWWQSFTQPYRHDGYMINILLKGSVTQYIDFEKHMVHAPALIMLEPEQIHQHDMSADAEMLNLYFTSDFLITETLGVLSCWQCFFKNSILLPKETELEELMAYAGILLQEFAQDKPQKTAVIRNILSAFIISCGRIGEQEGDEQCRTDGTFNNLVVQFKVLVDQHFREKAQVSDYADMLHVTPGHLNALVKNAIRRSAKQIIDAKRIMEAKRLLFWQKHSVKQIAGELNFDDDAYFNRFFKKHTGQTPALFQKTIREKYN